MRQQNTKSAPRRSGAPKRNGGAKRGGAPKRAGAPRGEKRFGAKGKRIAEERPYGRKSSERPSRKRDFEERPLRRRSAEERPLKRRKSEIEEMRSKVEDREPVRGVRHLPLQAYTPKPRKPKAKEEEGVRLNKFIANSGICSRREADEYIAQGLITVNGETVTELGTKVFYSDEVRFDGTVIRGEQKVYILMNKPKDFITTTSDPHAEHTVLDLIAGKCKERVYPVGRLDRDTTGVLLITNDGDLTEKLTHPKHLKKKIYQVTLDKNLKKTDFDKVLKGVHLDDGMERADALSYVDGEENVVGIEIHSGKNRVVRRIFESLGYKVKKLDRVYFAGLTKKNLRRGQWRFLTDKEIAMLQMGSYE